MSNVRVLPNATSIDSTTALELAKNGGLKDVLILGWTEADELFIGGTDSSEMELLYLIEKARFAILDQDP